MDHWFYNEFKHCGIDYADIKEAKVYDEKHQRFRDFEKEVNDMLEFLSLDNTRDMILIDLGSGTGATAIYAAKHFKKILAVDVSEVMIHQAQRKTEQEGISNIEFVKAGFLTYQHQGSPADIIVTKLAFHHLPDFWKQVALLKINRMLVDGGLLYIYDVVFNFQPTEYWASISNWISDLEMRAGTDFKDRIETHIRDEYSTFGWILEGMLHQAGFEIVKIRSLDGFITEYLCRKVKAITIPDT